MKMRWRIAMVVVVAAAAFVVAAPGPPKDLPGKSAVRVEAGVVSVLRADKALLVARRPAADSLPILCVMAEPGQRFRFRSALKANERLIFYEFEPLQFLENSVLGPCDPVSECPDPKPRPGPKMDLGVLSGAESCAIEVLDSK